MLSLLSVSKQALNAPLRQLLEMRLVGIEPAAHDRRVRQLALTAAGVTLEAQLTGTQVKLLEAAFAEAGGVAQAGWQRVMECLAPGS